MANPSRPDPRARILAIYRLNEAKFTAAGWRLSTVLALPVLAIRTALFPTDPPAWAPDAPLLPLLPAQRAVADRLDQARSPNLRRPGAPAPRHFQMPRLRRTGPSAFRLRDGALVEPLRHHAHPHGYRPHGASARGDA